MRNLPVEIAPGRTISRSPQPESFAEIREIAAIACKAPQVKTWTNVDDCFMAVLYGMDAGLTVSQALSFVMIVNGRPSIWGEAGVGLAMVSGSFDQSAYKQWFEHEGTPEVVAYCEMKRLPDGAVQRGVFSWQDAIKAELAKKSTYKAYPKDMLAARARCRALKRAFPDVLAGLSIIEEQQDAVTSKASSGQAGQTLLDNSRAEAMLPKAQPAPPTPTLTAEGRLATDVPGLSIGEPLSDEPIPAEDAQDELDGAAAAIVEDAPEDRERRGSTTKDAQQELLDRGSANAAAE